MPGGQTLPHACCIHACGSFCCHPLLMCPLHACSLATPCRFCVSKFRDCPACGYDIKGLKEEPEMQGEGGGWKAKKGGLQWIWLCVFLGGGARPPCHAHRR
jgi:hypothetical protein